MMHTERAEEVLELVSLVQSYSKLSSDREALGYSPWITSRRIGKGGELVKGLSDVRIASETDLFLLRAIALTTSLNAALEVVTLDSPIQGNDQVYKDDQTSLLELSDLLQASERLFTTLQEQPIVPVVVASVLNSVAVLGITNFNGDSLDSWLKTVFKGAQERIQKETWNPTKPGANIQE